MAKRAQPVYLTPEQRKFVEDEAEANGLTMNAYIVSLINSKMKRK